MIAVSADQKVVSRGAGDCGRELPQVGFAFLGSGRVIALGINGVVYHHGSPPNWSEPCPNLVLRALSLVIEITMVLGVHWLPATPMEYHGNHLAAMFDLDLAWHP